MPQRMNAQRYNAWKLGVNMGGTYQHSDIKDQAGIGWGVTVEKWKHQNQTHFFDYAWRFRYLMGTTYGKDHTRSYGIKNNTIFNNPNDSKLNYYQNPGFLYQNYKMDYHEFSLELLIGLNKLRERTGILAYGWGGIGITGYQTRTDQLDAFGQKYNYTNIDSAGPRTDVLSDLNFMRDHEYETFAEGSKSRNWRFAPSAGIGLGYQFTPVFSMAVEYKTTWPGTDLLDGQQWNNVNGKSGANDHYHYAGLHLSFSISGGKPKEMVKTNENNYSNDPVVVNPNPNPVNPNPNPINPNNNVGVKPNVFFTDPASGMMNTQVSPVTVTAKVEGVNAASSVVVKINGQQVNNFGFNGATHTITITTPVNFGSNSVEVIGYNNAGNDAATATINYSNPNVYSGAPAPVVTITYPQGNPYTTSQSNTNVSATVLNVNSKSQVAVSINNQNTTNFTYDNYSKVVTFNAGLVQGMNTVVITATNNAGSDSKFVNINYEKAQNDIRPVVTITSPTISPYNSPNNSASVTATVLNVASKSNISVLVNNTPVNNFSYDVNTKVLNLVGNLTAGSTTVTITATNNAGSDTKSTVLLYKSNSLPKPVVTITNPGTNPYNSSVSSANIAATVTNVSSRNDITIFVNGVQFNGGNYVQHGGQLTFSINLNPGANTVMINASNSAGSDSKSTTLNYSQEVKAPAPIVTITYPTSNPYTSPTANMTLTAVVLNVTSSDYVEVKVNNVATTAFSFDKKNGQLSLPLSLSSGTTTVSIKGTNNSGSNIKTETINYTAAPAALPPVVILNQPSISNSRVGEHLSTTGNVANATAQSQITVKFNGQVLSSSNWSYNPSSGKVIINFTTVAGNNTIELKATTPGGTDSKSVSFNIAAVNNSQNNPNSNSNNNTTNTPHLNNNSSNAPGNNTTTNPRNGSNNNNTNTKTSGKDTTKKVNKRPGGE